MEIIQKHDIDTQEELLEKLRERNFNVTQATVSRDINELKLIKIPIENGTYKYVQKQQDELDTQSHFRNLFRTAVRSIDFSQNVIVLKTTSGMAQGVCAALDAVEMDGILGTIAGDDTIFVVTSSNSKSASLASELKKIM